MASGQGQVAVGPAGGRHHDQHVAAFFDRHLLIQEQLTGAQAVDLSGCFRVLADIVRGKVIRPGIGRGKTENGPHHAPDQLGLVNQEQRDRGVADIDRPDAAVAEAFLGQEDGLAVFVGDQLVGCDGLTVGQTGQAGVGRPAGPLAVRPELFVKRVAARLELRVGVAGHGDDLSKGSAVPEAVGRCRTPEVVDRDDIVVS